jgi:protoporphyrinogen oxidase
MDFSLDRSKTRLSPREQTKHQDSDVVILGGGIAGLAAADRLAGQGLSVVVLESSERIGGMHRSVQIGPYSFDVGSIFYENNALLLGLVPEILPLLPRVMRVQRRIRPDGRLSRYPFDLKEILSGSARDMLRSSASLLAGRLWPGRRRTLEDISVARMGRVLFETTGLRNYMLHFNGLPPTEIDQVFFDERMRFVRTQTELRNILRTVWRGLRRRSIRPRPPQPLFIRPLEGYAPIFDALTERLTAKGVTILTGQQVARIEGTPRDLRVTAQGGIHRAGMVIGAMPLDGLHRAVFGEPSGLVERDLLSLFVSAYWLDPDTGNVLFNFHADGGWKRATIYSRLYPDPAARRAHFTVEVTTAPSDASEKTAARAAQDRFDAFAAHVTGLGLVRGLRLEGFELSPGAYPLHRLGQVDRVAGLRTKIEVAGITPVGRQGRYEYLPTSSGVIRRTDEVLDASSRPGS